MKDNSFFRSFRSLGTMFVPPFDGLWFVCTMFFLWSYLVFPHSPVLRGDLPDTDDYMYAAQLMDWLKGQGWYDNIQHRLDPPNGVPIHFSRFAMIPMAIIVKSVEFLGLGPKGSTQIMALLYPVMLLGVLFQVLRWTAKSFMPKEWAGITAYVSMFSIYMLATFEPGHIDHHNLIIILVALQVGCICRSLENPERKRWPVYAALATSFGMVVALEMLPWLLLLSLCFGIWSMVKGGVAARNGLLYGMTMFVSSAGFLLLTRPPNDLLNQDVLTYSVIYVLLTGVIALCFAVVFLASRTGIWGRCLLGGVVGAGSAALFLRTFPELIGGPYGGIDPEVARIILDEVTEAQPFKSAGSWFDLFMYMADAFIAIPLGIYYMVKAQGPKRWCWLVLNVFMFAAFGLSTFYQRRFAGTMEMLSVIQVAVMFQLCWQWVGAHLRGRKQFYSEFGLILLAGPLLTVILPAFFDNRSFNTGMLLFPVALGPMQPCETYELENILRNPMGLGDRQRLIMNSISEGPELLFRTNHKVLAGPYHMDVGGNIDSTRFFSTPYPEEAEAIARRRHIDLVVACTAAEGMYLRSDPVHHQKDLSEDFAPHFVERLINNQVPNWLKRYQVNGLNNYVIYEVSFPDDDKGGAKDDKKKGDAFRSQVNKMDGK